MSDMKLSEAIRLGAMLTPQAFGKIERVRRKYVLFGPLVRETCALGAAFQAANVGSHEEIQKSDGYGYRKAIKAGEKTRVMESPSHWPMHSYRRCPFCSDGLPLYQLIPHLNDTHYLSRELIAAFVEGVERDCEEAERFLTEPSVDTEECVLVGSDD